ncbi:hypothetical protein [Sphingomonas sp. BK235]|uniref:hypothetical protein n=1 Tax=Sphingomonas sp. BK235 TaxID=2512131 RepID=UPI001404F329|nr:hypothetical protein [Sphingomonas sp. BK235]
MTDVSVEQHSSRIRAKRAAIANAIERLLSLTGNFQQGVIDIELRHEVTGVAERFKVTVSVQAVS